VNAKKFAGAVAMLLLLHATRVEAEGIYGWPDPDLPYIAAGVGAAAGIAGGSFMALLYEDSQAQSATVFTVALGSSIATTTAGFSFVGSETLWASVARGALAGATASAVSCGLATVTGATFSFFQNRRSDRERIEARTWDATVADGGPTALGIGTKLEGRFAARGDTDCYTLALTDGDSVRISIEDEFSGLEGGADPLITVFESERFPPTEPAIYRNDDDRCVNKVETPIVYTARSSVVLVVVLESDNPGVTFYTIGVDEDPFGPASELGYQEQMGTHLAGTYIPQSYRPREQRSWRGTLEPLPLFVGVAAVTGGVLGLAAGALVWTAYFR
jgi:hypothetical protein